MRKLEFKKKTEKIDSPEKPKKVRQKKEKKTSQTKKIRWLPGIRTQLYGAFLLPILLMIFLGVFIYNKSSDALIDNYKSATLNTFTAKAEYLDSFMLGIREKGVQLIVNESIIDYYGKDYLNGSRKSDGVKLYKTIMKLVASVFGTSTDINAYYLFGENGNAVESITQVGVDYFTEYQESEDFATFSQGTANYMWTGYHNFLDEKVGITPDTYAVSLTLSSFSPKMYLICDVNMERMKDILNSLDLGEGSVVGFVSGDGREVLSDTDAFAEGTFTSLPAYADAIASENTEGFVENVKINGKEYCFVYAKIGETGAIFCGLVPEEVLLASANSIRMITIVIILIAVVLAGVLGTFIAQTISSTISKMSKGLSKASEGDLTVSFQTNGSSEFKTLAGSMNLMIHNTKHLIDEASKAGLKIKESSSRVSDTMQSLALSTQEISESFQEVEDGCTRQTDDVTQCANNMNQLAEEITVVSDKIESLKKISDATESAVTEGLGIVGDLNDKMLATSDITETVVTDISELEQNTNSVGQIVNVINSLSTQTNLLSLNASIEAARAGAAGRGFSVVAEEIRKLADETMAAGSNIQKLVQSIQDKTKQTADSTRQAGEIVRSQMDSLNMTMQLFHRINAQVTELTEQFETIMQQMVLMDDKKQSSMEKIENVAVVSEQSLTVVEKAASSAADQIATMHGLAEESRQLANDIASLEEAISKFKVSK